MKFLTYPSVLRTLLTCYVCSTKIGEISDISKCSENFVSQTLGVLTRIYAAELMGDKKLLKMYGKQRKDWWKGQGAVPEDGQRKS